MPTDFFASNGRQDIDDDNSDEIFDDSKTLAITTLDSCDIKPVRFLHIFQKTRLLKSPRAWHSRFKAKYYH